MNIDKVWLKDATERVAWTAAQAAVGVAIVELTGLNTSWAILAIPLLTSLKTILAKKVGSDSAAIGGPQG
jgi:uncharacterized membrane protein